MWANAHQVLFHIPSACFSLLLIPCVMLPATKYATGPRLTAICISQRALQWVHTVNWSMKIRKSTGMKSLKSIQNWHESLSHDNNWKNKDKNKGRIFELRIMFEFGIVIFDIWFRLALTSEEKRFWRVISVSDWDTEILFWAFVASLTVTALNCRWTQWATGTPHVFATSPLTYHLNPSPAVCGTIWS